MRGQRIASHLRGAEVGERILSCAWAVPGPVRGQGATLAARTRARGSPRQAGESELAPGIQASGTSSSAGC